MKQIAELAGVSLWTVSHVLNDTARVREAAQLALDRVEKKNSPVRHIVLKTELRIRDSVAPPPPETTAPGPANGKRRK